MKNSLDSTTEAMRRLGEVARGTSESLKALSKLIPKEDRKGPLLRKPSAKKRRRLEVRESRRRNRGRR